MVVGGKGGFWYWFDRGQTWGRVYYFFVGWEMDWAKGLGKWVVGKFGFGYL